MLTSRQAAYLSFAVPLVACSPTSPVMGATGADPGCPQNVRVQYDNPDGSRAIRTYLGSATVPGECRVRFQTGDKDFIGIAVGAYTGIYLYDGPNRARAILSVLQRKTEHVEFSSFTTQISSVTDVRFVRDETIKIGGKSYAGLSIHIVSRSITDGRTIVDADLLYIQNEQNRDAPIFVGVRNSNPSLVSNWPTRLAISVEYLPPG